MKKIYIVLTNTGTFFTKFIQLFTRAPYNHASISMDTGLEELYSFGRKKPKNPFLAGFIKEDVTEGTYVYYPETTCAVYELEVSDEQYEKMERIIREFKENNTKYKYNLIGLVGVMIHFPIATDKRYFCSQFVSEVLRRADIDMEKKHPSLVSPDDFRRMKEVSVIYEGNLFDYPPVRLKGRPEDTPINRYVPRWGLVKRMVQKTKAPLLLGNMYSLSIITEYEKVKTSGKRKARHYKNKFRKII